MAYNILITSAGQRVSLVRAFQKELKLIYKDAKVYTVDFNPHLAPACHVSDGFFAVKKVTESDYICDLLILCKELRIKLLIPTIDTELQVLAENKAFFLEHGIIPIVADLDFIAICRDKRLTNQFFIDHQIEVPNVIDKNKLSFPLFIKPYDGSLSKDTFLIAQESDLNSYHFTNEKLMFMEYIDPAIHDEYTVDAYYDQNGNLKCVVPRKRIHVRAGEVNKGVTCNNEITSFVINKLSHIKGAIGCLTMQFFFNPNKERIIGIEINPRFGGGYPLSYFAGANYPKFIMEEYLLGKNISFFDDWENNLLMLRYDAEVLVSNFRD